MTMFFGDRSAMTGDEVTEYAAGMRGGGKHVRAPYSEVDQIYPLAEWIEHQQRDGGKVYRRTIIVVEDWAEVDRG